MADKDLNKKMDELLSGVYRIEENQKKQFQKYDNDVQNIFNELQKYHKRFDIIENKLYSLESKIDTVRKVSAENTIDISNLKDKVS
ncbi:hypothetical protein GM661_03460 [Iocasia frigidifontis]|uniref:Uncharacterized protein n=1 Tax=Iocasia fonsfrigidae TaxID=2682810 RepID=A0A8A7K6T6_9FIRM|nr:hypothetical protein [Iocasia fonsfrigidae]QTL97101.1 hypothetical protein GM661_03460 [Iocasia fonsfrigidae]